MSLFPKVSPPPAHGHRIALVMDTQSAPHRPDDHLAWYGQYLARKQPDVIVCIGDFFDMPSLSTHDEPGSLATEGRRFQQDIDAGLRAMEKFIEPLARTRNYHPRMVFTLGNHEQRIERAVAASPHLQGVLSYNDMRLSEFGWEMVQFGLPVYIGGVAFCHYFPSGVMGRPISTAAGLIRKYHQSAIAGHLPGRDIAYGRRGDGTPITAIISGSFYQHDEEYMSPLANSTWRGTYLLHEVKDGGFDEMAISISYLKRKFGNG